MAAMTSTVTRAVLFLLALAGLAPMARAQEAPVTIPNQHGPTIKDA